MDGTQKIAGGFVITCSNASVLFEFLEEIFDQVPPFVHLFIIRTLFRAVAFGRNHHLAIGGFQFGNHAFQGVIGFIRKKSPNVFDIVQKRVGPVQIMGLARGQVKARGVAQSVARGVNFCG